jgi:hypothetical protein
MDEPESLGELLRKMKPLPNFMSDGRGDQQQADREAQEGNHEQMSIWIDTEFNETREGIELISLGMVDSNGETFYGETDFDRARATPFVESIVIPLLSKKPEHYYPGNSLRDAATRWLFRYDDCNPVICADFQGDLDLLRELLIDVPAWLNLRVVWHEIDKTLRKQFFELTGLPEHHALYDAQANRFAHRLKPTD